MLQTVIGALLLLGASTASQLPAPKADEPSIRVECHGKLRHGIAAIGGETTGTTIAFNGLTWELKLPDAATRAFAQAHHKSAVVAVGSLRQVRGVEAPVRWIVDVERLAVPEKDAPQEGADMTIIGNLRHLNAGMVIESDGLIWPVDLTDDISVTVKNAALIGKSVRLTGRLEQGSATKSPSPPLIRVKKLDALSPKPQLP